jgi:hypothetical protein
MEKKDLKGLMKKSGILAFANNFIIYLLTDSVFQFLLYTAYLIVVCLSGGMGTLV